jgi:hypothetical protein
MQNTDFSVYLHGIKIRYMYNFVVKFSVTSISSSLSSLLLILIIYLHLPFLVYILYTHLVSQLYLNSCIAYVIYVSGFIFHCFSFCLSSNYIINLFFRCLQSAFHISCLTSITFTFASLILPPCYKTLM